MDYYFYFIDHITKFAKPIDKPPFGWCVYKEDLFDI